METTLSEELLRALDLEALAPEEQEALMLELHDLIARGSILRLMERMDEGTKDRFAKLVEGTVSNEEIEAFIVQNVPDANAIVAETVRQLTDDIVTATDSK